MTGKYWESHSFQGLKRFRCLLCLRVILLQPCLARSSPRKSDRRCCNDEQSNCSQGVRHRLLTCTATMQTLGLSIILQYLTDMTDRNICAGVPPCRPGAMALVRSVRPCIAMLAPLLRRELRIRSFSAIVPLLGTVKMCGGEVFPGHSEIGVKQFGMFIPFFHFIPNQRSPEAKC